MNENTHGPVELQPPAVTENVPTAGEDAPPVVGTSTEPGTVVVPAGEDGALAQGTGNLPSPADVGAPPAGTEGELDQADDDDDADPSAGMADVDVTQPNPYAGPLGYVGKFASDGKLITDSAFSDELDAGAGDQLDQAPDDQLDQTPPA